MLSTRSVEELLGDGQGDPKRAVIELVGARMEDTGDPDGGGVQGAVLVLGEQPDLVAHLRA